MGEIERAAEYFEWSATQPKPEKLSKIVILAALALREKAEREKGCEYCNGRFGIAAHHINDAGLQAGTNKIAKFCPMCGRPLKEAQAWLNNMQNPRATRQSLRR